MSPPRPSDHHNLLRVRHPPALRPPGLGQLPRDPRRRTGVNSVLPPDLHYLPAPLRWQPEYPDDVHPNSRKFSLGGESGCSGRHEGLEYLGRFSGDRLLAGDALGDGDLL